MRAAVFVLLSSELSGGEGQLRTALSDLFVVRANSARPKLSFLIRFSQAGVVPVLATFGAAVSSAAAVVAKQCGCVHVSFENSPEDVQDVMLHLEMPIQIMPALQARAKSCTELSVSIDMSPADSLRAQVETRRLGSNHPWQHGCTSAWVAGGAITVPGLEPGATYELRARLLFSSGKTSSFTSLATAATLKGSESPINCVPCSHKALQITHSLLLSRKPSLSSRR